MQEGSTQLNKTIIFNNIIYKTHKLINMSVSSDQDISYLFEDYSKVLDGKMKEKDFDLNLTTLLTAANAKDNALRIIANTIITKSKTIDPIVLLEQQWSSINENLYYQTLLLGLQEWFEQLRAKGRRIVTKKKNINMALKNTNPLQRKLGGYFLESTYNLLLYAFLDKIDKKVNRFYKGVHDKYLNVDKKIIARSTDVLSLPSPTFIKYTGYIWFPNETALLGKKLRIDELIKDTSDKMNNSDPYFWDKSEQEVVDIKPADLHIDPKELKQQPIQQPVQQQKPVQQPIQPVQQPVQQQKQKAKKKPPSKTRSVIIIIFSIILGIILLITGLYFLGVFIAYIIIMKKGDDVHKSVYSWFYLFIDN